MPDWDTRLEVTVGGVTITPIDIFNPRFSTTHTVIHSIESDRVGYLRRPFEFTFDMTIQANAAVVADLVEMALNAREFDVSIAERRGTDWTFSSVALSRCIITSTNPSNIIRDGIPVATFSCLALEARAVR